MTAARTSFKSRDELELVTLRSGSGLTIDLFPNGAVCAIRHEDILVNQSIGVPPEGAPFRLWLRDRSGGCSLIGPASARHFGCVDDHHVTWSGRWNHWSWVVHLVLSPDKPVWFWHVDVTNEAKIEREVDAVFAQDLGLGGIRAVRSNEAYISHYIDHTVLTHPEWGPVICSKQNLAQADQHPWVLHACHTGAAAFATDAEDVFGRGQRVRGEPVALTRENLPSLRRQGESACAALQTLRQTVHPSGQTTFTFSAAFLSHHPEPTTEQDLKWVPPSPSFDPAVSRIDTVSSIWDNPTLLHGQDMTSAQWDCLYPARRHEELVKGKLWSFFTDDDRHVVSAAKEAAVERPHGNVLFGSCRLTPHEDALGTTVYAPGIFNAQIYYGNPNLSRLLTVVRDSYQRTRGCGQRVWVDQGDGWSLLGSPSAFEMGKQHAVWLYQLQDRLLEITSRVNDDPSFVMLTCRVREGEPVRWRVTHQLALDANELDSGGTMDINAEQDRISITFDRGTLAAGRWPDLRFVLTGMPCHDLVRFGADELVWLDGKARGAPYVVAETRESLEFAVQIDVSGIKGNGSPGQNRRLPGSNWKLSGNHEVMSLADILPWFRHNAWIHLCSPHGLEQYGGAAWGVRDVCQGPVEWLITEQRYEEIRGIIETVFSHQYRESGLWPQWFMLGACADIQQKHCHGDVMFWPLKALCDYAEAANDPGILDMETPYTHEGTFQFTAEKAPLSEHVDRVVEKYQALCIPGTMLVAYGDGDWDDTLQPLHPEMREGMVSAWTVELAYQVFGQVAGLYRRSGRDQAARALDELQERIRADFMKHMMPDGIVAGFANFHGGNVDPLLHPRDGVSGIRFRLLPMTRGIISGIFDQAQAAAHREIIREYLRFPDGVRLMDHPVRYAGGRSRMFQRAETAAYFGREVSLQYVHAHLRYAEAMMKLGDGEEAWWALQVVNPLGLGERLPNAAPRQANVYFSSSDADFADRYEASKKFDLIRSGRLTVKSGWRLYSSGPGLFLHKVRCGVLGVREYYDRIVFDPVLPERLRSCVLRCTHEGRNVALSFEKGVEHSVLINGRRVDAVQETGRLYRTGGLSVCRDAYRGSLSRASNDVRILLA